ncbi:MAG: LysR family transcriptional regulator [Actinomycetota bacterium]|nr:LysR family transcriptional regulator [Actinomycetota bacterium]
MELRQLRYAVAVADAGHFGRAAQRLRIAQSGLSQQIKALERLLGTALFVRDTRHVALTPAGRVFMEHARVVLELADRAEQSVRLIEKGKTGLIKVATNAAGLSPAMSELLNRYRERYPHVEVELHPGFGPQNLEALELRRVDLAVVTLPTESAEPFNYLRLGWIEILAIVPEAHRLASFDRIPRDELVHVPFLTLPRSVNPRVVDHMHDVVFEGREPLALVEAIDMAATARISKVAEDAKLIGFGFGSESQLETSGVVFRSFEEPLPRIEHGIAWFDTHASSYVDSFVGVARELLG